LIANQVKAVAFNESATDFFHTEIFFNKNFSY